MKRKVKTATLFITAALASVSMLGCTMGTSLSDDTSAKLPTDQDLISTYTAQIEHYEELIRDLEDRLLYVKEENYITTAEYKSKIQELENRIAELSDKDLSDEKASGGSESPGRPQELPGEGEDIKSPSNLSSSSLGVKITDGKITVTNYSGNEIELVIPSEIDGVAVVAIGESAFAGSRVQKLILPEGITSVDWFAFYGCSELREITIPSSISFIGYGAFDICSPDLTIICESGSYAEAYAISWGIAYKIK